MELNYKRLQIKGESFPSIFHMIYTKIEMTFSSKYMMQLTLKTIVIMMHHLFYFYVWRLEMKERNTNRTRSKLKGFAAKIILWEKKGKYQSLDKQQKSNKIKESRILRTRQMIGRDIFLGKLHLAQLLKSWQKLFEGSMQWFNLVHFS